MPLDHLLISIQLQLSSWASWQILQLKAKLLQIRPLIQLISQNLLQAQQQQPAVTTALPATVVQIATALTAS